MKVKKESWMASYETTAGEGDRKEGNRKKN
jgi:hypothetical protein